MCHRFNNYVPNLSMLNYMAKSYEARKKLFNSVFILKNYDEKKCPICKNRIWLEPETWKDLEMFENMLKDLVNNLWRFLKILI